MKTHISSAFKTFVTQWWSVTPSNSSQQFNSNGHISPVENVWQCDKLPSAVARQKLSESSTFLFTIKTLCDGNSQPNRLFSLWSHDEWNCVGYHITFYTHLRLTPSTDQRIPHKQRRVNSNVSSYVYHLVDIYAKYVCFFLVALVWLTSVNGIIVSHKKERQEKWVNTVLIHTQTAMPSASHWSLCETHDSNRKTRLQPKRRSSTSAAYK